jgi:hypothetical protein
MEVDEELWVVLDEQYPGRWFLQESATTFPAWVTVVAEARTGRVNVPVHAITATSLASFHWLRGFMHGAEPSYELMYSGLDLDNETGAEFEVRRELWLEALAVYRRTGCWHYVDVECPQCGRTLLPSELLWEEDGGCRSCDDAFVDDDIVERWHASLQLGAE